MTTPPIEPITVVLDDDHGIVRQGLAALLRPEPDIRLLGEAADGEGAWRLIENRPPKLAILDLSMPGADGIEVTRRVEAAALPNRVLLLTMHNDPHAAREALNAGVAGFVVKENSYEELLRAVRVLAAGGCFVSPVLRVLLRGDAAAAVPSAREREVLRLLALGPSGTRARPRHACSASARVPSIPIVSG